LIRLLNEKVNEQEKLHARSFVEQVQAVMRTALTFEQVSAARLAAMFNMHVRTFHRRLADHGTSHQELLDKTRHSLACQLLEEDRRSLPQIAELLGYAEMRSFIRAFKRWSGTTPTDWRRRRTKERKLRRPKQGRLERSARDLAGCNIFVG
jgi:AraC-like DNA-binding protein